MALVLQFVMLISSLMVVQVNLDVGSLDVIIAVQLNSMSSQSISMDSTQFVVKLKHKLNVKIAQVAVDFGRMDVTYFNDMF